MSIKLFTVALGITLMFGAAAAMSGNYAAITQSGSDINAELVCRTPPSFIPTL